MAVKCFRTLEAPQASAQLRRMIMRTISKARRISLSEASRVRNAAWAVTCHIGEACERMIGRKRLGVEHVEPVIRDTCAVTQDKTAHDAMGIISCSVPARFGPCLAFFPQLVDFFLSQVLDADKGVLRSISSSSLVWMAALSRFCVF